MKPKNEKYFKTLQYIFVYILCLLLAVAVWLGVMYTKASDAPEDAAECQETVALPEAEPVCSI